MLDTQRNILLKAELITGSERPGTYGHPRDHFARTIGAINAVLGPAIRQRLAEGKPPLEIDDWPKILILDKLARSMKAYHTDNLVDIAGYARTWEMLHEGNGQEHQSERIEERKTVAGSIEEGGIPCR